MNKNIKLLNLLLVVTVLCGSFSTYAQKKTSAAKCSGAWTGIITYTRIQSATNNKTVERVSARGQDTTNFQMNSNYKASVAVVESPEKNGSSIGKATINANMTSTETVSAVEKNSCDRGKTWRDMRGESTSKTEMSGDGKEEANVNVGVNDDETYSVSVGVSSIRGIVSGSQTSTFSGQCTPKEGKNLTMQPTETSIDGHNLTSDGSHRINPSDPNTLSGNYSLNLPGDVVETISWNLKKCGAPLQLIALEFEDMKFPNWDDWQEIVEQKGTIDGNWVKIKAKILNASPETKFADLKFKETYKGDKWDGARPDGLLENGEVSVRLEAGEEKDVEMIWDSSGYSWFDDGRPRLLQRIKVELEENGKKIDEQTKNLKVAPKPVVLVHGLWSSWKAWETWQNIFTTTHSYDWKAFPVGEKPSNGVMNTGGEFLSTTPTNSIAENAREVEKYIKYAQEDRNAWHVDVVAHSMGGLITRYYISQIIPANYPDGRPQISHLVMLGTPNQGSPCADVMNVAFETLGKNVEAVRQLRQDYVENFNKVHTQRKGVKFSVLAGNPLPTMCKQIVWNDGVVPVPSAKWTIKDNAESKSIHTDLTGTSDFSSFVKPHLAIGPKGNHNPEMPYPTGANLTNPFASYFVNALYKSAANVESFDENFYKPDFAKAVKISAKSSIEIEIPVAAANDFGLTFMASPEISATLYNEKGEIVDKNLTKTPEANAWFRSIFVDKKVAGGTWKLKLENASERDLEAVIATWNGAVK